VRISAAACAIAIAATTTAVARGDIGVVAVSRTTAHPRDVVYVRVVGYDRPWPRMPLYLVPATRVPQRRACGPNAICEPRAKRPPTRPPYTRIGQVHFRHSGSGVVRFHVPSLIPGRYRFVVYCAPCYRGPGGSLVVNDAQFFIR
jgi:hypothetical protein